MDFSCFCAILWGAAMAQPGGLEQDRQELCQCIKSLAISTIYVSLMSLLSTLRNKIVNEGND